MLSDSSRYYLHADTFPFAGNPRGSCNAIRWLADTPTWTRPTCLHNRLSIYLSGLRRMRFFFINPEDTFLNYFFNLFDKLRVTVEVLS